ncbi:hypothetical protein LTR56_018530 [Elasticomyces elasticus]|nr:hypothetical protein LTR56_018530 [Elasticomyces elasticus]KAK3636463.1 hypothetical protein LTR22_018696 [Elasticomyces elasticus]KAK4920192.1 hypothetical protein LTR49_012291 [Elasticomyces elasticus]KAK5751707.1 hypothetical protein LTS12_018236 [Elasticomyces elasticus]
MELAEQIALIMLCSLVVLAGILLRIRLTYDKGGYEQLPTERERRDGATRPETELQRLAKIEVAKLEADREKKQGEMAPQRIELEQRRRALRYMSSHQYDAMKAD